LAERGASSRIKGASCYLPVLGFLVGYVHLMHHREDKFVRFHALQTLIIGGRILAIQLTMSLVFLGARIILIVGGIITLLAWVVIRRIRILGGLLISLFLMFKAGIGDWYSIPLIGDFADKIMDRFFIGHGWKGGPSWPREDGGYASGEVPCRMNTS
jgi:uncharacterized membrane protein